MILEGANAKTHDRARDSAGVALGQLGACRKGLLIRSRKQDLFPTCRLSVDGVDPWVHVRGCPWLSVVVDVPTDVDRGCSVADYDRWLVAPESVCLNQLVTVTADHRRSCTVGLVWHPVDLAQPDRAAARGQPSMERAHA
jgi:hypothetical protein